MKLAIVGTGMISGEVLPVVQSMGHTVAAVCATPRSKAKAEEWCKTYGIPAAYTDYAAMLAEVQADAVYLGLPNVLHYRYAKQALEASWNVIVEKPFTSNAAEAEELAALAKQKHLFLYEAITTRYLPNYHKIQEWLPRIGTVKIVTCNFSQYSSRYDAFCKGIIAPAFDPAQSGGALMDLNLYNLQWVMGLFGAPKTAHYAPNMERGIDTSGILTLEYENFQAVCIAAKDCGAPCNYTIQGTKGYILQTAPANGCLSVSLHLNDGTAEEISVPATRENYAKRLEPEFAAFAAQMESGDWNACLAQLEYTVEVCRVMTLARLAAGLRFAADDEF